MPRRVIAISNCKGGTGKTTTAVNLASALAEQGARVLLIDLDPQGHASIYVGVRNDGRELFDVFTGRRSLASAVVRTTFKLDLVPAGMLLAGAEKAVGGEIGAESIFREHVATLPDDWDFVIMDCSPSLGLLMISALTAADEVLIPVIAEAMPYEGVAQFLQTIQRVQTRLNPALRIMGVLPLKTDATKLSQTIEGALRKNLGDRVFDTVIRKNVKVGESFSKRMPVSAFAKKCPGTTDYAALAAEVLGRVA